jgi:N utilization substance protein B
VLQGLYQRRLSHNDAAEVRMQLAESSGYERADADYFDALWRGLAEGADAIVERLGPLLDRAAVGASPVERAILAIGAWELEHRLDIPYRVVINEADRAREVVRRHGRTQVRQRRARPPRGVGARRRDRRSRARARA